MSLRRLSTSSWNRIGACCAMGLAGRYRIEISSEGIVAVVDSDDRLDVARSLYWHTIMKHPRRLTPPLNIVLGRGRKMHSPGLRERVRTANAHGMNSAGT
jgi:hypothetical protein